MKVLTDYVEISMRGHTDIIDITQQVEQVLGEAKLKNGNLTVLFRVLRQESHLLSTSRVY